MRDEYIITASSVFMLAWLGFWIQAIIRPFLTKYKDLQSEYARSGRIDQELSRIDAEHVFPTLTTIYETAIGLQEDKRRKAVMPDLLTRMELAEPLKALDAATKAKAQVSQDFSWLCKTAQVTWKSAVLHVTLFLAGSGTYVSDLLGDWPWLGAASAALFAMSIVIAAVAFVQYLRFVRREEDFEKKLGDGYA